MANELEMVVKTEAAEVVVIASSMTVSDKETFDNATTFLKTVKSVKDKITDYWKTPKEQAYATWKSMTAKESEMLAPLKEAEQNVRDKMNFYTAELNRKMQEEQKKLAEARKAEADRMMAEAAKSEAVGDVFMAEMQMNIAQSMDTNDVGNSSFKQKNVRVTKQIVITDEKQVPDYIDGICIRPVDEKKVMEYYKLTGKVPSGVTLQDKTTVVIR